MAEPASDELIAKFQTLCDLKGPLEVARVSIPADELRALLASISRPSITADAVAWRYRWRDAAAREGSKQNQWTVVNLDPALTRTEAWRAVREIEPLFAHPAPEGDEDEHITLHIYEGDSALVIRDNGNKTLHGVPLPELLALFSEPLPKPAVEFGAGDTEPGDHERGCQGREYTCTCGYDDKRDARVSDLEQDLEDAAETNDRLSSALAAEKQENAQAQKAIEALNICIVQDDKRAAVLEQRVAALEVALTEIAEFNSTDKTTLGAMEALGFCRKTARAALKSEV